MIVDGLELCQEFVLYFNVVDRELTELWWSYQRSFVPKEPVEVDVRLQHYVVQYYAFM